jgi:hypothetical protein
MGTSRHVGKRQFNVVSMWPNGGDTATKIILA